MKGGFIMENKIPYDYMRGNISSYGELSEETAGSISPSSSETNDDDRNKDFYHDRYTGGCW